MAEVLNGALKPSRRVDRSAEAVRAVMAGLIGPSGSTVLPNYLLGIAPGPIKRLTERYFDFPVRSHIRERGILLIRIPRTASVSLSLAVYGRVIGIPHRTALFYRKSDPILFANAVKFAVVRHPVERLLSAYYFLKQGGTDLAGPNVATRRIVQSFRTFEQFLLDYVKPNAKQLQTLDPTLHPQSSYVCDRSGEVIVENIFKLESMAPLVDFLATIGISGLEKRNTTNSNSHTLSSQLEREIFKIYEHDADLFQYSLEARQ